MSFRSARLFAANRVRGFSSNVSEKNPKILRKIILGSALGAYGYYQWEHYNRNIELAKKLDIPFYKVMTDYNCISSFIFLGFNV